MPLGAPAKQAGDRCTKDSGHLQNVWLAGLTPKVWLALLHNRAKFPLSAMQNRLSLLKQPLLSIVKASWGQRAKPLAALAAIEREDHVVL